MMKKNDLKQLGYQRLEKKKQRMSNLLKIAEPDEALYREIMLSLGYKHNKIPFLELATLLPYSEIRKLEKREIIEKALLFRAGFIDDKIGIPDFFDFSLRMSKDVWTYSQTRPANFPEKRIYQISYLLEETIEKGIFHYFKEKIERSFNSNNDITQKDVKKTVNNIIAFKGLGASRKIDVFFNIIIPFYMVIFNEKVQINKFLEKIISTYPPTVEMRKIAMKYIEVKEAQINSVLEYFGVLELSQETNN